MRPPWSSTIRLAIDSPRPVPPFLRVVGVVDLLELLEDPLLVGLGDAGSRVRHRDDECHRRQHRASQPHLAGLGELDRVADEVQQHLGEAPIVAPAARQVGGDARP